MLFVICCCLVVACSLLMFVCVCVLLLLLSFVCYFSLLLLCNSSFHFFFSFFTNILLAEHRGLQRCQRRREMRHGLVEPICHEERVSYWRLLIFFSPSCSFFVFPYPSLPFIFFFPPSFRCIMDSQIFNICEAFQRQYASVLPALRNNYILHLTSLFDFGLLTRSQVGV